jgi:hypothetical protein
MDRGREVPMVVTPDIFQRLRDRVFAVQGALGSDYSLAVFAKLVEHIEPHLVITDTGCAAEWYEYVERARADIINAVSHRGRPPPSLDGVARIAQRYWMLTGPHAQRRLAFISDAGLRRVAEDDWTRLVAAGEREDAKTTAIAAGSVVEAIALDLIERLTAVKVTQLRDHLNALPPSQRMSLSAKGDEPSRWTFAFLLLAVGPRGLHVLSERTHTVGHTLRDWRNLVHPDVARAEPPLTAADGRLAAGFAEKVIEDVGEWESSGRGLAVP